MSAGVAILVGVLLVFGLLVGLQLWMGARMRGAEGREAPPLGALGDPEGKLVWFFGPTCGPCHAMRPGIDALGDRVIVVDVSKHFDVAQAYGVMATPTTVLVRGGHIAAVRTGVLSREALASLLG